MMTRTEIPTDDDVEQRVQKTLREANRQGVEVSADVLREYYTPDEEDN